MKPGIKNVTASVLARLRTEASELRVPFNQVLQFYAMERFLHRLSRSSHADGVLLKGALLLRTVGIPRVRPTMDIDLLRRGKADRESLIALVRECALVADETDGVTFDPNSIVANEITKDSAYQGTRIVLSGRMDNVRLNVQIDFGVGDAVSPGPRLIEYPTILDQAPIRLQAYPVEAAIAEKFQAMVALDLGNSRMKDFYDIWACLSHLDFDGETLKSSIAATFERRATSIPTGSPAALTSAFFASPLHQTQWKAFTRKILEPDLAESFPDIVGKIDKFLMLPAGAAARGEKFPSHWKPNGPWSFDV
jgi:predicted nucleotidyltransferase component of viral defense system